MPTGTASESIFGALSLTLMYGNMWIILAEALMFSGLLGHCFFFFLGENVENVFSVCKQRAAWVAQHVLGACLLSGLM